MLGNQQPDLHNVWRWFEQEILYARNYNLLPSLSAASVGVGPANPILEQLLPGLLTIKVVSLLDEGLKAKIQQISSGGESIPKDLYGRIEFLAQRGHVTNPNALHAIKDHRNVLAHETEWHTSWDDLTGTVDEIRACLQAFGIIREIPQYEIVAEQSALRESADPNAQFERTIRVAVKSGGKEVSEISFTEKVMKDDA